MARKKGKEQDSRAALLEAAYGLLLEQGAAGMSVEAIVARADLSKGTFFHFFPGKKDLLDALCARIADEGFRQVAPVLERTDIDPVARFDEYLQASRAFRLERSKAIGVLWRELARDDNAALMKKVRRLGIERAVPFVARIFVEANALGRMRVAEPELVARLVIEWMHATVEGTIELFAQQRDGKAVELAVRRANATMEAMERVLGTATGALQRVDEKIVGRFAAEVPAEGIATLERARRGGRSGRASRGARRRRDGP